ncbi:MAG: PaaI family thioesterase [Victivallaceae bacterium]|nr:PaaI family thioesterase [Victivallaceae bacterium]
MKVLEKQRNSRMCAICGMDNSYGVRAPFYNMADGSVMSIFRYGEHHQSYPGRVHGGLITAMLDEMGLRALWANHRSERDFGVTISLETNFRKPVPYDADLLGRGVLITESSRFFAVDACIMDRAGQVLANARVKYIKLDIAKIAGDATVHEEMPYLIEDGVTEIEFVS